MAVVSAAVAVAPAVSEVVVAAFAAEAVAVARSLTTPSNAHPRNLDHHDDAENGVYGV